MSVQNEPARRLRAEGEERHVAEERDCGAHHAHEAPVQEGAQDVDQGDARADAHGASGPQEAAEGHGGEFGEVGLEENVFFFLTFIMELAEYIFNQGGK